MFKLPGAKKSEELRRQLDEEDVEKAIAEDLATIGDVVTSDKEQLYRQAASLACQKLGLEPDEYFIVTVPEDQTRPGSQVPEGMTRITIGGEQSSYGSGLRGGVLGVDPFYDALKELESHAQH